MSRSIQRIDELARDIPPPRDLWPAINAAILNEQIAAADAESARSTQMGTRRRGAWLPAAGLAAGMALVALGVLIGRNFTPQAALPVTASNPAPVNPDVRPAALRDAEYRKQRDQLVVEVQTRLQAMPAPERDKVAASLLTLQRSIAEIEAALGRDPANALLQELLVNSCQEEMRALTVVRDSGRQEI
jgi:hypothetical protein